MIHVTMDGLPNWTNLGLSVNLKGLTALTIADQTVLTVGLAQVAVFAAPANPNIKQFWLRNDSTAGQIITLHPTAPVDQATGKWLFPGEEWASFPNWGQGMEAIANAAGGRLMRAIFQTS